MESKEQMRQDCVGAGRKAGQGAEFAVIPKANKGD